MVSQELPNEPVSSVLRRCAVSDMNDCRSHPDGICFCSHWNSVDRAFVRPHSLSTFQHHGAHGRRSIEPFSVRCKEDDVSGSGHLQDHGLSLSLGPELEHNNVKPYNYNQAHILVCDRDVDGNGYNLRYSNSMAAIGGVLQKSPYLNAAQQLLDEVVCVRNSVTEPSSEKNAHKKNQIKGNSHIAHMSREEQVVNRMNKLLTLQEELERQHMIYFHRMDELVTSFEAVGGPGSAAPYTALTSQAMSKHFSNLRESIMNHIDSSREAFSKDAPKNNKPKRESLQHLGMIHVRQVWRPLRGLPEDSVMVLRAWLFEHFLHPYPNDNEKLLLASQTGLTRNQISNWFINARVRLWKPMIEEMYREEFGEDQEDSNPSL